jgi:DNA-binding beta-propeller fold protein YncE
VCSFNGDAVGRFDLDDGSFLGNLGPSEDLDGALGITLGVDGNIYVASEESNMVLGFGGGDGAFVTRFVADDPRTVEDETGGLMGAGAVLFGPDGALYVSSFDSDAILRYDGSSGAFIDVFVSTGSGGLDGPDAGTVFGPDGDLYVPGYYSNTIERYDGTSGAPVGDFTPNDMLDAPRTVLFAGEHMYVANEGSDEVLRFDASSGEFVDVFVVAGAGGLEAPAGMVIDPSGVLHVASVNGNTVLRFDEDGEPLPTLVDAVAGGIDAPTHITIAPAIAG